MDKNQKKEKLYYDYSVGLNTPYWIQELRTPKGKLIFKFETPQNIAFFIVAGVVLLIMFAIHANTAFFSILHRLTFGLSIVLWVFLPLKTAKFYCEYEPDGKMMHQFLLDALVYYFGFILDKREIKNGVRVKEDELDILEFEKTSL